MVLSAGVLLLATLLLSYLWLIFLGLQEDVYLSALSPWDYSITDGSAALSLQIYNQDSHALTEEAVQAFRSRPETTSVSALTVSYTHLDVYKRQPGDSPSPP